MSIVEISRQLLTSRKELLDIGLRNNMINFRAGAKSLYIENRLSVDILDILCHQNKAMTIVAGLPEKALKQVNLIDEIKEDEASSEVTSLLLAEMDSWKNIDFLSTKAKATSPNTDCYLPTRLSRVYAQ